MPFERQRLRQQVARHGLPADGGEDRPAQRQADAVGEGQQQQQVSPSVPGQRQAGEQQPH